MFRSKWTKAMSSGVFHMYTKQFQLLICRKDSLFSHWPYIQNIDLKPFNELGFSKSAWHSWHKCQIVGFIVITTVNWSDNVYKTKQTDVLFLLMNVQCLPWNFKVLGLTSTGVVNGHYWGVQHMDETTIHCFLIFNGYVKKNQSFNWKCFV